MRKEYINPNIPVFADMLGVILFSWLTYYFYKKSLESPLSIEEKALFLFVVLALIIDSLFVLFLIVLPRLFKY